MAGRRRKRSENENGLNRLFLDIRSTDLQTRAAAIREARELPPEQLLELARMRMWKSPCLRRRTLTMVVSAIVFSVCILNMMAGFRGDILIPITWTVIAALGFASCYSLQFQPYDSLADVLAEMEDPRFLAPLLTLLHERDVTNAYSERALNDPLRRNLLISLKRMLPRLTADPILYLTADQMRGLLSCLRSPFQDTTLTLRVLTALEQVGDERAIPIVAELAEAEAATAIEEQIQAAARACLPALYERAEQVRQGQNLLRASAAATIATPDLLLRPSLPTPDRTPAEQLLRPMDADG